MNADQFRGLTDEQEPNLASETIGEGVGDSLQPWEMIAPGRYMPRRVRGSCHGRELG
jgi:hypothetical protein